MNAPSHDDLPEGLWLRDVITAASEFDPARFSCICCSSSANSTKTKMLMFAGPSDSASHNNSYSNPTLLRVSATRGNMSGERKRVLRRSSLGRVRLKERENRLPVENSGQRQHQTQKQRRKEEKKEISQTVWRSNNTLLKASLKEASGGCSSCTWSIHLKRTTFYIRVVHMFRKFSKCRQTKMECLSFFLKDAREATVRSREKE